ncbi:MAG: GNAT family N-acetyltransferase [bacterium]|nr:GNAT family N-acetyltransferase [bacterium]
MQLTKGISEKQIDQLIQYSSSDEVVAAFTSDPERFKDRAAYDAWLQKGRTIYTLGDEEGNLLGIVWLGRSPFPKVELKPEFVNLDTSSCDITVALRIYGKARGKGLAKSVLSEGIKNYLDSAAHQADGGGNLWLETSADNIAAIKTYEVLFEKVSEPDAKGKIIMVLKK